MESVKKSAGAASDTAAAAAENKKHRLPATLGMAGACVFISVMFVVIGMENPWAMLPAVGGPAMLLGYRWGNADRMGARKLQLLRRKKQVAIAASSYSGSGDLCGDSYRYAVLPDGKFAVAVSDGTGKGKIAARESGRAADSIIGLLKAGMDPEMALRVLNLILAMDNRKERFPTMDLAVLDPDSRELLIYKIGAAPTVIKRAEHRGGGPGASAAPNGKIEILTAPAVPMGVMECARIPCVSTMVSSGDRIIMMTDGIVDSQRDDLEARWLKRLLGRIKSRSTRTICDLIIREAAINYGTREKDDMTVVSFVVG